MKSVQEVLASESTKVRAVLVDSGVTTAEVEGIWYALGKAAYSMVILGTGNCSATAMDDAVSRSIAANWKFCECCGRLEILWVDGVSEGGLCPACASKDTWKESPLEVPTTVERRKPGSAMRGQPGSRKAAVVK